MNELNYHPESTPVEEPAGELVNTLRQPVPETMEIREAPWPEPEPTQPKPKKVVPVPDSPLSAPNSIREMLEKKRREGGNSYRTTPATPITSTSNDTSTKTKKITPVPDSPLSLDENDPDYDLAVQELSEIMLSGKPLQQNPDGSISVRGKTPSSNKSFPKKHIPVPDSPLSVQQWYLRDPDLYNTEVQGMREYLEIPHANPEKLSDGRLFWDLIITPQTEHYTGMDYRCLAVYDHNHPHAAHGSSVEIHPIDPTLQEIEEVFITSPVVQAYCEKKDIPPHLPHTIKDKNGNLFLCNMDKSITTNDLNKGIISAVSSVLCAKTYFLYLEGAVLSEKNCAKFFAH